MRRLIAASLALTLALTACAGDPPVGPGTIQGKTHHPKVITSEYECSKKRINGKKECHWEEEEESPEHCTLHVLEDSSQKLKDVDIPCTSFDTYQAGMRWNEASPNA